MMTDQPLVSIITPVYNGADYLEKLIESVRDQDYPNVEHIVIDDGSTDDGATIAILKCYPHLRWWNRENKGQYATMNEGLEAARGEYVCFVCADDIISPGAVTSATEFLGKNEYFDGVFGITNYIDPNGSIYPYLVPFRTAPIWFYPYFAHISHCSLYIKRSSLQLHGLTFNPSLRYTGDYEWMIRIYRSRLRIGVIHRELSRVRIHADQVSQKHLNDSSVEKKKVIAVHRISKLLYSFLWTIYLARVKIWRVDLILRDEGIRGIIRRLVRRYKGKDNRA